MRSTMLLRTALLVSSTMLLGIGAADAAKGLPKELVGLWCAYSPGPDAQTQNYLRNDASAPKPDTPCSKSGKTDWIVLDGDGGYQGRDYKCRTSAVTVIDRGVVIKGQPGANAVYGIAANCRGTAGRWKESARIDVERWGSALTIKRSR